MSALLTLSYFLGHLKNLAYENFYKFYKRYSRWFAPVRWSKSSYYHIMIITKPCDKSGKLVLKTSWSIC